MGEVAESTEEAADFLRDSIDARLIAVLDHYSKRDLIADKPEETETLQQIGISPTTADRRLRKWINDAFRTPNDWRVLGRDALPVSTTFAKLRAYCTAE